MERVCIDYNEGKSCALRRMFTKYWTDRLWDKAIELEEYVPPDEFADFLAWMQRKKKYGQYKYYLVTINPEEGKLNCDLLCQKWKRWKTKKWIGKSVACIEWREHNTGMHLHAKIMINRVMKKKKIKESLVRTFGKYVGNNYHINLIGSNRKGCFSDYIIGKRKGKWKENHSFDVMNRESNNIPATF